MGEHKQGSFKIFIEKNKLFFSDFFAGEFFKSALNQWVLVGSLVINIINCGLITFFVGFIDFPIILHYNVYFGVDVIGSWWQLYFLPLIGILILCVNTFLGRLFYEQKERIIGQLLVLATFIVQICISIAVASLLIINY